MEELLNKLIEKGWKPFGFYDRIYLSDKSCYQYHKVEGIRNYFFVKDNGVGDNFTLRELVSKESGLWKFVCENRKYGYTIPECWIKNPKICDEGIESVEKECNQNSYEYYVIESALKEEKELEQFLLQNIKVE